MMISRRQRELQEALPDAIDLITVCVEAGLGLDAAMNRAGEELALRSQALADELKLVALERRVGSTRASALNSFALRTGVDDIATFVTLLIQTEHLGTNVADSLRILSDTMRVRRTIRTEEAAAKIPLKLLFPLIFFMFPSLFLVLLGPVVINISRTMLPTLGVGH
jgi:tight adherence protein C